MGLLDRVKSAASPDSGMAELQVALKREAGRLWLPLYADESRIKDVFAQRAPNVVEMVTGGEFTLDVSGGYMSFASVKAGHKVVANQKIEITPLLQTLLLKEGATDLTLHEAKSSDTLLYFVGPGRFVLDDEVLVGFPEHGVTPGLAAVVQKVRESQEKMIRKKEPEAPGTIVWLAQGPRPVAAIANFRGTSTNFPSYIPTGTYGVLGTYERGLVSDDSPGALTLLTPLMIWHHAGI